MSSELQYSTATIDATDATGRTSLSWAAARNDYGSMTALLEAGADPQIADFESLTPLTYAVAAGDVSTVNLLLSHGADIAVKDTYSRSLLHCACDHAVDPALLPLLIAYGLEVNEVGCRGNTPLFCASLHNQVSNALCLLEAGANPNIASVDGHTPFHVALLHNLHQVIEAMLLRGVDPTVTNTRNETLLFYAAKSPNARTLNLLASAEFQGLDPATRSVDGISARDVFLERADPDDTLTHEAFERLIASLQYESHDQLIQEDGEYTASDGFENSYFSFGGWS